MTIAIEDDHLALLATARRFTGERIGPAVVREAVADGTAAGLPPFWSELAGMGWLGLAVAEADGGEGYGLAELAVVLEELGRVVAPGPALPTAWAAALLPGHPALGDLVSGALVGSVAVHSTLVADGAGAVSGTVGPVLCGGLAELVVVPFALDGEERWGVLRVAPGDVVRPVESLDLTRPLAMVDLIDRSLVAVDGLTRGRVEAIGVALAAAECAGGAAWCVDTAASYAQVRRQFGRPIGQFQAVKHRCADMLVRLEQVRAVAWDAARALDHPDGSTGVAVAAAGAIALDGYVDVAKDCIQVLGGIGFTWEHDAHLYLRRGLVLRQLLGGATPWRRAIAEAALAGTRRELDLDLPPEAESLRAELAPVVDAIAALPKDERRAPLADAGLLVPHWAPPWGRDATAVEQVVIDQELRRVRVRPPHLQVGAWAAPTIVVHGTVEQQERWVRPTLHGEIAWCQLFSEPEAGSDLAALTTAAAKVDGGWSLNGQKVWTSMAKEADWGICLARTDPSAPKHLGITYFIVDMRTPGIDIRPLREMTGMEMFNEVWFDDVFVPDDCVVGEIDGGWPLARTTLANERVSMGSGSSFGGGIESLLGLVSDRVAIGVLTADSLLLDEVGALVAEAHSIAVLGLRTAVRSVSGAAPGSEASVRKLLGVEHDQRTQEAGLELLGPEGAMLVGAGSQWAFGFLANRCLTIAGGTSEVQRNVIGERLLGLPAIPNRRSTPAEMPDLLPDQLRLMAEALTDEVAFTNCAAEPLAGREADVDLTFGEWERRSNRLARWLVAQGVEAGDRVAIHLPPEEPDRFLVAYSATHKAGAVAVPTSTRLVARELGEVLAHAGAVVAISGTSTTPTLLEALVALPELRHLVTTGPIDGSGADGVVAWDAALASEDDSAIQVDVDSGDIADLMYTSGTTGRPKGVVVRHGNVAMVPNGMPRWSGKGWLHASPMFTFAGIASTYNPMKLGLRLLYLPRFDVDRWFDLVEGREGPGRRPTATFIVPAMAELLLASPRFDRADLTGISICSLGSAPVAPGTIQRLQEHLPNAMVSNSWGMTEAGPSFCFMPPEEQGRRIGSVGRPVAPTEFRIVDADDHPLPAREIGELLVRNPGREREYFNDAEATAATWRDGWLHSGDLAYLDEDGFLYIVGRQKDVIIRGGNNVHATDVEAVLFDHPAVQEVAVAGVAHPVLGEDVGAWVVVVPGTVADDALADELRVFTADRLSDYKRPRVVTFVAELPRNATGKVVKRDLPGRGGPP